MKRIAFGISGLLLCAVSLRAAVFEANPGDDLKAIVRDQMNPGDTLQLRGGTYTIDYCIKFTGKAGTAAQPLIMESYPGEYATIVQTSWSHNIIEINDSSYVTIRNMEITTGATVFDSWDGIKSSSGTVNHHITLENLHVHHLGGVAISTKGRDSYWTIRNCEVSHSGEWDYGEAMYLGVNGSETEVFSHGVVEFNFIHDITTGVQCDGIEIKGAGHGNIVRHNVIYNCQGYPGITLYHGEAGADNIVEGNVVWACGDHGIQTCSNTVIRNNIVINAAYDGIYAKSDGTENPVNVVVVNNTVYNSGRYGIDFSDATNSICANNAVYALSASDVAMRALNSTVTSSGNVCYGDVQGFTGGVTTSSGADVDMANPANQNFWPASGGDLIDAGDGAYAPGDDFNAMPRPFGSLPDAGAYEWSQVSNPGWEVQLDFKQLPSPSPDTTPPALSTTHLTITGTASDNTSILNNEVLLDGIGYSLSGGMFTAEDLSFVDGRTYIITAEDPDSNSTTVNVTVNIQ